MDATDPSLLLAGSPSSKTNFAEDKDHWKGYDAEDVNLLFSIIYRAIFKDDIFSANSLTKKEILIDGENKEYRMPKENKVIKMISEGALKRIVGLPYFEAVVKIIFEEKYPLIKDLKLDLTAIIENILKNFKSVGEPQQVQGEEREEKSTDEDQDLDNYKENLQHLYENLAGIRKKLQSFKSKISQMPDKIADNLDFNMMIQPHEESNLSFKNLTEAKLKMGEDKPKKQKGSDGSTQMDSRVTRSSGGNSSNTNNGNKSNLLSKDGSMSVSNSNGNGSHGSNERFEREEEFDKEYLDSELKDDKYGIDTQQEKVKLPKAATDVLRAWFLNNLDHPYPNADVKEELSEKTNLSKKQIQNWFTNSRKRFLEPTRKKFDTELKNKQTKNSGSQSMQMENGARNSSNNEIVPQPMNLPKPSLQLISEEPVIQPDNNQMIQQQPQQVPVIIQNPHQIPQIQYQPYQNYIPQPIIYQNPGEAIPQTSYYYTNGIQTLPPQNQGTMMYPPTPQTYYQPQYLIPAGYMPQQQPGPIILNPQPQGTPVMVNRPVQNYIQPGVMPQYGTYLVPVQNFPVVTRNGYSNSQNMGDMRGIYAHNLSTNYNTIHNNVFNSISHPEVYQPSPITYAQPVYVANPKPNTVIIEENNDTQNPIRFDNLPTSLESNNRREFPQDLEGSLSKKSNGAIHNDQNQYNHTMKTSHKQYEEAEYSEREAIQSQHQLKGGEEKDNSSEYMGALPSKKIHKEENGINGFKQP